jgi:uncharacterized protein YcbK (DUF882 family)
LRWEVPVLQYKKKEGRKLSDHFISDEWDCPCDKCVFTLIDLTLVERLEQVRALLSAPIRINSGYRCASYQAELKARGYETAVGTSQHELGKAADIMADGSDVPGGTLETLSRQAGFKAVGVGHNWCHVDLRDDKERRWEYVKR